MVPWLLALDQAVFAVADWASGVHADRVLAQVRRLVPWLLVATFISTCAFVALPWIGARLGAAAFVALAFVCVVTTAALRAPPMALLGNCAPQPVRAWVAGLSMLALGLAGGVAPYLAIALREVSPRLPFLLAGSGVMLAALTLLYVERSTGKSGPGTNPLRRAASSALASPGALFAVAFVLATGFQAHVLALPVQIQKALPREQLKAFMPIFWLELCLIAWPAVIAFRRYRIDRLIATVALALGWPVLPGVSQYFAWAAAGSWLAGAPVVAAFAHQLGDVRPAQALAPPR
jgi:hypothetical protein